MKKLHSILLGTAIVAFSVSCSDKIDEAYMNPNAQVKQPIETLLPNVIQNMAVSHTANGTLYGVQNDGRYIMQYIQNWANIALNENYDSHGSVTGGSDNMGSIWACLLYTSPSPRD